MKYANSCSRSFLATSELPKSPSHVASHTFIGIELSPPLGVRYSFFV